ncbi:hypothetical protein [Polaromonas aquatica]|uniref:hypothetical protein n=1 Tax=Polaromonas aquatica TaxID=332657 RepID=UPI003D65692B
MTFRPESTGFDRCGTLTYFSPRGKARNLHMVPLPCERMRLFVSHLAGERFGGVTRGPGRAASHRERAAHHAAGYPQNRSFNQAPRLDRGISPVSRCSNAFTPTT